MACEKNKSAKTLICAVADLNSVLVEHSDAFFFKASFVLYFFNFTLSLFSSKSSVL